MKKVINCNNGYYLLNVCHLSDSITINLEQLKEIVRDGKEVLDNLPKPCPHAALIKQYAEDCQKYERPWELWEVSEYAESWHTVDKHLNWHPHYCYRRKGV
jgi:hypothetical protein